MAAARSEGVVTTGTYVGSLLAVVLQRIVGV
jgi:hypothetical protein